MNDEVNNSATSTVNMVGVALVEIANEISANLVAASTVEASFMLDTILKQPIFRILSFFA